MVGTTENGNSGFAAAFTPVVFYTIIYTYKYIHCIYDYPEFQDSWEKEEWTLSCTERKTTDTGTVRDENEFLYESVTWISYSVDIDYFSSAKITFYAGYLEGWIVSSSDEHTT